MVLPHGDNTGYDSKQLFIGAEGSLGIITAAVLKTYPSSMRHCAGLATAQRLQQIHAGARIAVLEKEAGVAAHQSGHNSGVIHAGVYCAPGSLKARLCREGLQATLAFCAANDVPHRQCGKLIVATDSAEVDRLQALAVRGADNGLALEWWDAAAIAAREPEVRGLAALYVRETGIADYPRLCHEPARLSAGRATLLSASAARRSGGEILRYSRPGGQPRRRNAPRFPAPDHAPQRARTQCAVTGRDLGLSDRRGHRRAIAKQARFLNRTLPVRGGIRLKSAASHSAPGSAPLS